jgi:hypothetical protein
MMRAYAQIEEKAHERDQKKERCAAKARTVIPKPYAEPEPWSRKKTGRLLPSIR